MKRKETSTRFVFKLTAIIVSVMLLLITAHFMMIHSEAHVHAYSHMGPYVTNSSSAGFHRYVTGTVTDSNGNVTYLYGSKLSTMSTIKKKEPPFYRRFPYI